MVRRISVIGLGGTIAMTRGANGLQPARSPAQTLAAVAVPEGIETEVLDHLSVPSGDLSLADIAGLAQRLREDILPRCDGAVVIQGTDTLEETSFALELLLGPSRPVAMTGAMRAPVQMGPDGPANLQGALRVAAGGAGEAGVFVVLNDEAHAARYVRKGHTTAVSAFTSGDEAPLWRLHEGALRQVRALPRALGPLPLPAGSSPPDVALVTLGLGAETRLLESLPDLGYRGIVIAAMGAGHVPSPLAPVLGRLAARMPVVLCSRTGQGRICEATYGYPGSETDLLGRGLLSGGGLGALKARILLSLCLAAPVEDPAATFTAMAASV